MKNEQPTREDAMKRTIFCFLSMMIMVCAVFSADLGGNAMRKTMRPEANGIAITTSIPDTLYADTLYSIPLTATYAGNGTLVWTVIRQPSNMQEIADTIVWLPTLANVGNDTIIISVSDGSSSDTMTKPIVVRAEPAVGITTVFPDTFYVDSLYYLHLSARYSGRHAHLDRHQKTFQHAGHCQHAYMAPHIIKHRQRYDHHLGFQRFRNRHLEKAVRG